MAAAALPSTAASTSVPSTPTGAPDSKGRDFWLAFLRNYVGGPTLELFVTSAFDTSGTVTIPGLGVTKPFTVAAGKVTTVALPSSAMVATADGVESKGVHVTAADEVTVYGLNRIQYTTDAFLGLPTDVLGTDHIVLAYGNTTPGSEFAVAATEDATSVTITPSVTSGSRPKGVAYTVHLDAGQVYQLTDGGAADLSGTLVASDKPVAVFGGHKCAYVPANTYACDHLAEQIPPTGTWGKDFVTVPLATRRNGDTFRFLAAEADTQVRVNGTLVATLGRGQVHERIINGSAHILANHPLLVAQYSNGSGYDGVTSDPFMLIVPPVEQFQSDYTITTPATGFRTNFVNVVAPTTDIAHVRLDDVLIPAAAFTPIASSGFSGAQLPISLGSHTVRATVPLGLSVYGFDSYDSYGYQGGGAFAEVARATQLVLEPKVAPVGLIGSEHCVTATVSDQAGLALPGVRVDFSVAGANTAAGFAATSTEGTARFCYRGTKAGDDTISANVGSLRGTATKAWSDNRPPVAVTGGPYSVPEGGQITLDGTGSSDPDGDVLELAWDLDGDGAFETREGRPVFSAVPLDGPSTRRVSLRACDPLGACNTAAVDVEVTNVAPQVSAGADLTVFRAEQLSLSGTWTDPAGPRDAPYAWSWDSAGRVTQGEGPDGSEARTVRTFSALGEQPATLTVTDDDGGVASDKASVLVLNRPPSCAGVSTNLGQIWPPDHRLVDVPLAGAVDPDGDAVQLRVLAVQQDEPLDARGDGSTEPDAAGIGTDRVQVRAERAGTPKLPGDGRVYTISVRVTDTHGASCIRELTVGVPHDSAHGPALNSGKRYDSLSGRLVTPQDTPTVDVPSSMGVRVDAAFASTAEDTAVDVQLIAHNVPGPDVSFRVLGSGPTSGSVIGISPAICVPEGDGTTCHAQARYQPATNWHGNDQFRFVATDGVTGWEGAASVSVSAVNDVPVLRSTPARLIVAEDSGDTPFELRADDVETPAADLQVQLLETPAAGQLVLDGAVLAPGATWTGVPTTLAFRTAQEHSGELSFRVRVRDTGSEGLAVATSDLTVRITVTAVDDAPVAEPVAATTSEDVAVELMLRATDVDTDRLTFTVTTPSTGSLGDLSPAVCETAAGSTTCRATVLYTPAKNAFGRVPLTFTSSDGVTTTTASGAVEVTPVNDPPTLVAAPMKLDIAEDSGRTPVGFTASDLETPATGLQLRIEVAPARGTLRLGNTVLARGDVVGTSTASLSYEPFTDANGADRFSVSVLDGPEGGTAPLSTTLEVPVTVAAVDDPPVFDVAPTSTPEDTAALVMLNARDVDSSVLTFSRVTAPGRGTATSPSGPICTAAGAGVVCSSTSTYRPGADLSGPDSFDLVVTDGRTSVRRTASLTVTPVNDAPVPAVDRVLGEEAVPLTIPAGDLLSNDLPGPVDESAQRLTITAVAAGSLTFGTVQLRDGAVTYTSAEGFRGEAIFSYTVCDDGRTNGANDPRCATGTVTVEVAARNRLPIVTPTTVETPEDVGAIVTLQAGDPDGTPLQFSVATPPAHGTLGSLSPVTCTNGLNGSQCTATVRYTPAANYNGSDSFVVQADDGRGSAQGTANVTVAPVNDAPTLTADPAQLATAEDVPTSLRVAGADVETDAAHLVVTLSTGSAFGELFVGDRRLAVGDTFSGEPTELRFVPHADQSGSDAFRLTINDGGQGTPTVLDIPVKVTEVNDPPTAGPFSRSVQQDQQVSFPVSELAAAGTAGPADEAGQHLAARSFSLLDPTTGTLSLAAGVLTYTPAAGFVGTAIVRYQLCDDGTTAGAADPRCADGQAEIEVHRTGPAPTVTDVAPADGSRVTVPVPVTAGISPTDGSTITTWAVTATLIGGGAPVTVASGTGTPPTTLGTFDPTVLANGVYRLVVSAQTSAGGSAGTESTVIVDGQLKLGRFAATYKDADAALGDVVLPVMRSYDSLDKVSGDFGYGWQLSLDGMRVASNRVLGAGGWEQYYTNCRFGICDLAYRTTAPHFVAVTFPDGHVESFDLTPKDTGSRSFAHVAYTARKGTTSTLAPLQPEDVVWQDDGQLRSMDDLEPYDPKQFRLTTRTGRELLLDVTKGLLSLNDADGTTYAVTDTGITSTAGGGASWTRDAKGRITELRSGGTTTYGYDAAGNLETVTDPLGRVVTYTYDGAHRMLAAKGPGGVPLRTMNYDAQGRLVSVTDADGNTTAVSSDPGARTQTITDPTGRLTTLLTMDALGGIVNKVETSGGVSRTWSYTHDEDGRQTSETDPLGRVSRATYNAVGDVLSQTDAAGATTSSTYGPSGQVLTTVDAVGRTTRYGYDAGLHLTSVTDAAGRAETYGYDSAGRKTSVTDRRGGETTYGYDSTGRVTSRTDALGRVTRYSFDAFGRLEASTDGVGAATRFERDAAGQLLSRTDPLDGVTRYSYDALGRTISRADPTGAVTTYSYAAGGTLAASTDAVGGKTSYGYDAAGRLLSETDPTGARTTYDYDGFGRLVHMTDPLGHVTLYAYDPAGQLVSTTNPAGGRTSYSYDLAGRRTGVTDPGGGTTTSTYDLGGRLVRQADALGAVTRFEYDLLGRRTKTVAADAATSLVEYDPMGSVTAMVDATGARTEYRYDVAGQQMGSTDATGRATSFEYDAAGRPTRITDSGGHTSVTSYDGAGRVSAVTKPSGATTTYRYDSAGRLVSTVDALGNETKSGYDVAGRRVSETDGMGRTTRFTLDGTGRTTAITDPLGGTVRLAHDLVGNLTSVTDAAGVRTSYTYDVAGNRTAEVDGLGNRLEWAYDDLGRETAARNARGQTTTSRYDAAGQLIGRTTSEGPVTQAFDAVGRRTSLVDPSGTTQFRYDALGRLTETTSPAGAVTYGYDAAGRRTSLTAGGQTAAYEYDTAGQLARVTADGAVTRYAYDTDGNVTSVAHPNGVTTGYRYDAAARMTGVRHEKDGAVLAEFSYTLDANGSRTAVDGSAGSEAYSLDAAGRLTDVSYGDGTSASYDYDLAGNRTSVTAGGSTKHYGYDAAGRLASVDGVAVDRDADGNTTALGGQTYAYDSANRLVSLTADGVTSQFGYDADGRRVTTRTGSDPIAGSVYDTTGAHPVLLARGDTAFLRDPSGQLLGERTGTVNSTPLLDALGSVRAMTSDGGALVGTADYDAFGAARSTAGTASMPGFTGAPTDQGGLVDLNAREYDPSVGQFLQRDTVRPAGPGTVGWNTYTYANNNPSTLTDLSGHFSGSLSETSVTASMAGSITATSGSFAMYARLIQMARVVAGATGILSAGTAATCYASDCLESRDGETPGPDLRTEPTPVPRPPTTDDDTRRRPEVLLDTNAAMFVPPWQLNVLPSEKPVVSWAAWAEIQVVAARPGNGEPNWLPTYFPPVPDEFELSIALRLSRNILKLSEGKRIQGYEGDVVIGTTAIVSRRPLLTDDSVLRDAVNMTGGMARPAR